MGGGKASETPAGGEIGFVSHICRAEIGFVSHFWVGGTVGVAKIGFVSYIWIVGQAGVGVNWVCFA